MALSIKLYAHGVPKGQKIWGATGMVGKYIETFYHPYTYEEQMYVETKNIDGTPYCFYTFIKGKTVLDYEGRAGAYLALTLQINAFYVDIQNIYNILSAAYKKMCIGSCVKENGGNVKFCISDFSQVNDQLQTIENKAIGYIGDFSNNDDLKGIGTSQNSTTEINLQECTKDVATALIGRGKIVVSPLIPSSNEKAIIDKKNKEIDAVRKDAQRQIDASKQEAQQRIEAVKKEKAALQQNLQVIDDKHKKELDNLRSKHKKELEEKLADSVAQISALKKDKNKLQNLLDSANSDCKRLFKENDKLRRQLQFGGAVGPISSGPSTTSFVKKPIGLLKKFAKPLIVTTLIVFVLFLLTKCVKTAFGCTRNGGEGSSSELSWTTDGGDNSEKSQPKHDKGNSEETTVETIEVDKAQADAKKIDGEQSVPAKGSPKIPTDNKVVSPSTPVPKKVGEDVTKDKTPSKPNEKTEIDKNIKIDKQKPADKATSTPDKSESGPTATEKGK